MMSESWSHRIATKLGITLDESLRAWFDEAWWARRGAGEFASALSPQRLLDLDGEVIWPGLLPPDLLPIIGNDLGDWLCLRVSLENQVTEIVYWNHGGGDWIPYGPNLPEALLYAASQPRLDSHEPDSTIWPTWAAQQLASSGKQVLPFWHANATTDSHSALVEAGVAQTPLGRDICLRRLCRPTLDQLDRKKASALGIAWEPDLVSWLFDSALAPPTYREKQWSEESSQTNEAIQQDWQGAEMEALKVEQIRANLGWPMDLAAWAAERRGDLRQAIPRYLASLNASMFSDESVRFRTLWFPEGYGKFAAARLWELRDSLSSAERADPYLQLLWENDRKSLRDRVSQFWLEKAEIALENEDWRGAMENYFRAGWDVGMPNRSDYLVVLEGLGSAAQSLGATALSRLTSIHLAILEAKYR